MSPRDQLRESIERWRASEARAALDAESVVAYPTRGAAHLHSAQELEPGEASAAGAHLARAAYERSISPARQMLRALQGSPLQIGCRALRVGEGLAQVLRGDPMAEEILRHLRDKAEAAFPTLDERVASATEAALAVWRETGALRHDDAGPETALRHGQAEAFLSATVAAGEERTRRASLRVRLGEAAWAEGESLFGARDRYRRVAALAPGLSLGPLLRERVRVEGPHEESHPRSRLALVDVPRDIRIRPSHWELGWISEAAAAEAVGRAAMRALAAPALPPALRRAPVATPARALGLLFVQLLSLPEIHLRRGLSRREAEVAARRFADLTVRGSRVAAACATGPEAIEGALGAPLAPGLAAWLASASGVGARWRSARAALALFDALRERYDFDWYRNPRVADVVRYAGERAGWLSVEDWLDELGCDNEAASAAAIRRLGELVP